MVRFAKVSEAMISDQRLTCRQFKILCALMLFADSKTGEAHPKKSQIAEATGIAQNKISEETRALSELGWIEKHGSGGHSIPTTYTVFSSPNISPEKGLLNQPRKRASNEKTTSPKLGQNQPQIGTTTSPKLGQNQPQFGATHTTDHKQTNKQTNNRPVATTPAEAVASSPQKSKLSDDLKEACQQTWERYSAAYFSRYGVDPVKNAKVAGQVVAFVKRVPQADAPHVAQHYVASNSRFYVERGHAFGSLLADAEKLRTEWATGRSITSATARQIDSTQSNFNAAQQAKSLLAARSNS